MKSIIVPILFNILTNNQIDFTYLLILTDFNQKLIDNTTIEFTNTSKIIENNFITNVKNVTALSSAFNNNIFKDFTTPAVVTIGLLVFILFSPIVKRIVIGTTSIDLTIVDSAIDKKTELEFIEIYLIERDIV